MFQQLIAFAIARRWLIVFAALCLAAPIFRSTREELQDQVPLLREAADQLAAVLPPRPR